MCMQKIAIATFPICQKGALGILFLIIKAGITFLDKRFNIRIWHLIFRCLHHENLRKIQGSLKKKRVSLCVLCPLFIRPKINFIYR